ncbi:hypothetical protein PMAYCL1PPCAC_02002, partial [Pristionchus mayeri]
SHEKHMNSHRKGTNRRVTKRTKLCTLCPRKLTKECELAVHLRRHQEGTVGDSTDEGEGTEEDKFECKVCGKKHDSRELLERHEWVHRAPTQHCPKCPGRSFVFKKELDIHMILVHFDSSESAPPSSSLPPPPSSLPPRQFKCTICSESFPNMALLVSHKKLHQETASYKCKRCQMEFDSQRKLNEHARVVHGGPLPHECFLCGMEFAERNKAMAHRKECRAKKEEKESSKLPS